MRRPIDHAAHLDWSPEPVLHEGMQFSGLLVLPGPARIDGRVSGEIIAGGALWIGETGEVEADLEGEVVVVAGRVRGDVRASARIELRSTAVVSGSLCAPRLVLAEGSIADGPCDCGELPDAGEQAPERPPGSS
jgi:cytoskeletal protein CcmA (bactofilin family)